MKYTSKFLVAGLIAATLFSCTKKDSVATFANGTAPVLASSVSSATPTIADTSNVVLTFQWSNPHYATDSNSVIYTLEIDTVGGQFANPIKIASNGSLSTPLTGSQVDSLLLTVYGLAATVPYNMEA